ncbi:chromatin accessibility complex protein 1 isoform X3 [Macaca fascicularis]|uniref:chromatin accessibility complex protein 1 isoform X3 n=1 Tax=Macaca fascicularis TaxID=9541 RepID=UPI003D158C51
MADVVVGKDKCGEQRLISLPLSRIRVIMKSSPEVSSINQEALVLTAKATGAVGIIIHCSSWLGESLSNSMTNWTFLPTCNINKICTVSY